MQKYTGSCVSYSYNEISEKAKERAFTDWATSDTNVWNFWWDEAKESLDRFCSVFDINIKKFEFSGYGPAYWSLHIENDALDDDKHLLSGIRLAKYIWNNYADYIMEGKYYHISSKSRRSRVMKEVCCPFTGVCYDDSLLEKVLDCLHYKRLYDCYEDLMNDCIRDFFNDCQAEYEYRTSQEYFAEDAEANELEFYEDGSRFYLPTNFITA